jgi:hypothetical protein
MSDASPPPEAGPPRPLRAEETALVRKLLAGTRLEDELGRPLAEVLVGDMSDGGMGSIRFCATEPQRRLYGSTIGEGSFLDRDGTLVWVALNLDQFGNLFELDMWKVDFSPLLRYPDPRDFKIADPEQKPSLKRKGEKHHA